MKIYTSFCVVVVLAFYAGWLSKPSIAHAQNLAHIVRVVVRTSDATIPPVYGTPVAISCTGETCYVLTQ